MGVVLNCYVCGNMVLRNRNRIQDTDFWTKTRAVSSSHHQLDLSGSSPLHNFLESTLCLLMIFFSSLSILDSFTFAQSWPERAVAIPPGG